MTVATARSILSCHVADVLALEAVMKGADDNVVEKLTSLEATVATARVDLARRVADVRALEVALK